MLALSWLTLFPTSGIPFHPFHLSKSTHLSRPSSNITSSVSFLLSVPHSTLLHGNTHSFLSAQSALSLSHGALHILPLLASLLDCGLFICIFPTNSQRLVQTAGTGENREYRGCGLPFHVQYDSQCGDKHLSIPTNYTNDPKKKTSYCSKWDMTFNMTAHDITNELQNVNHNAFVLHQCFYSTIISS